MLKNYIKIALRTISRSASYTVINVSGLALGMTCALVIFLLVDYHLSFDNFHKDGDRIYRLVTEERRDITSYANAVPPIFGKAFREDYTFSEAVTRMCDDDAIVSFEHNGVHQKFNEQFSFAEPMFFEIFNFPIVEGVNDLGRAGTAIVSQRIAKKFFGDVSPLGKTIRVGNKVDAQIVGVMADMPDNTDLRQEILVSYLNIGQWSEWYASDDAWGGITSQIQTYTRLKPGVDPLDVENVLVEYPKKFRPRSKNLHVYHLQPLSDLHFNPHYGGRISSTTLVILSVIGFFLVFTACLNFINLATAQAVSRSREVGVRKVLGSARMQLFWQFTMETLVIVLGSFFIAFCACYALVPMVNELLKARVSMPMTDITFWVFSISLIILLTFLSGAYPGMVLSGFKPVQALKGKLASASGSLNLRRVLITTQFAIAQVLLIGLIVVISQMHYFRNADMGFDQKGVVMIPLGSADEKSKTVKQQFLQLPNVESVTRCFAAPASEASWGTSIRFDARAENEEFSTQFKGGDDDYVKTFGLQLIAGRDLLPSDTVKEMVVNETLVDRLGETPDGIIGKNVRFNGDQNGIVVGVVKDFNDRSLHNDINPVFITTYSENFHAFAVKINMQDIRGTLAALENTWSAMYPEQIFNHTFLEEETAQFYAAEEMMLSVVQIFSFIALFIGCLGLYGLVSFMSVQKTKEIGIRKALGGSLQHILWIFGREFTVLIVIAFLVAAPVSWALMSNWLSNFEYQVDLAPWIFALDLAVIGFVAIVTVGFRSAKAALMNPINALRSE